MNIKKDLNFSMNKYVAIYTLLLFSWQHTASAFNTDMASEWYKKYILSNPLRKFIPGYPLILDSMCIPGYAQARIRCFSRHPLHAIATVTFYEAKDIAMIKGAIDQKRGIQWHQSALTIATLCSATTTGTLLLESLISQKSPELAQKIVQERALNKALMLQTICYGLGRLGFFAYETIKKSIEQ